MKDGGIRGGLECRQGDHLRQVLNAPDKTYDEGRNEGSGTSA